MFSKIKQLKRWPSAVLPDAPDSDNGYSRADANFGRVKSSRMPGAMIVISRPRVCHRIVVGFLRAAGHTIRHVRVRLSDASGIAIEEKIWSNDSTDATALAEEVAHHIIHIANGRSDLQAVITVSDGSWSRRSNAPFPKERKTTGGPASGQSG